MLVDVVVNPFGASVRDMVEAAVVADRAGVGAVWVTDHFSGAVVGARWSRDPFVCLGAIAAATERCDVGVLVANMVNRHPVALVSAVNSLQSLAPGRVRLGVGSGAAPGSRFAVEHEAIGRRLDEVVDRRNRLERYLGAVRAAFDGAESHEAGEDGFDGLTAVTDGAARPQIIVGASAWPTIEVALRAADGVNVRRTARLGELLERIAADEPPPGFEVSVLETVRADAVRDLPADLDGTLATRRIVTVSAPFDLRVIEALGGV